MSNIDNELAFGEYVSIPIRTEKTAEQKLEIARAHIKKEIDQLDHMYQISPSRDYKQRFAILCRKSELKTMLDDLDT